MLYPMKWQSTLNQRTLRTHSLSLILAGLLAWVPLAAQAEVLPPLEETLQLSAQEKFEIAQLDRREGQTMQDLLRDPSRAALLSTLYPGLGQLYVGNDQSRSLWIMGGGTVIIVGSIVGFALLADRPPEASTLGNLMILGVLLGYHLWNIRDAYVQADDYNKMLEQQNRLSWMNHLQLGMQRDTLTLSWSSAL